MNSLGVVFSQKMFKEILKDLKVIVKRVKKVEKIVLLGDVRHSFGKVWKQEKKDLGKLFDFLEKSFPGKKIILIRGNHDTLVVGHFHPAIDVTDGEKSERFKCFLIGMLKRKKILVVPSFFPLVEGANILGDCYINLLPIKKKEAYVLDDNGKIYNFGKIDYN